MLKIISILFTSAFLLVACKKNEPIQYTFLGNVTDEFTGEQIPDAEINFSQLLIANSFNFVEIGGVNTDQFGVYEMAFNRDKSTEIHIEVKKDNHFPHIENVFTSELSTENTNFKNFALETKSFVQFKIKNLYPEDDDSFNLVLKHFKEDCDECATNGSQSYFGELDTVLNYVTTGNRYVEFVYVNLKTGIAKVDSIYTTPFDTSYYSIVY
ncbi:hypothetical protein [Crocinitomix catalasitica]|uniref:hypothetical protein n=1 Tax=Crocinitomix catalasitica TaxID=184607 RepID=UPI0004875DCB|nr:hypothetical protein [Crocinitomix catalasitica]